MASATARAIATAGLLAACLAAGAARCACRAARVADFRAQLTDDRLFLPLKVNDISARFMLDTGASHSVVDAAFAARAHVAWDRNQPGYTLSGLGGETLPVRAGRIRVLDIAGIKVFDREMPIHDFRQDLSGETLDGLFGADLISVFDLELDFSANRVSLWRLLGCREIEPLHWTGDYAAIPMRRRADLQVEIPIELDGADLDAVLDTGAGGLLLTARAARAAGASEATLKQDALVQAGGIGGQRLFRRHVFHTLRIGKETCREVPALVSPPAQDGMGTRNIVGLEFLRGHRAWLSYSTETLFLQLQPQASRP